MTKWKWLIILFIILATACTGTPPATSPQPDAAPTPTPDTATPNRFTGITIRMLIPADEALHTYLTQRITTFEAQTGATVILATAPVNKLAHRFTTHSTDTPASDVALLSTTMLAEAARGGYLADLTARIQADSTLQWNDVPPYIRDSVVTYQGNIYAIPLDADVFVLYVRHDVLEQAGIPPPATWEDAIAIARRWYGEDINGDGTADYGACLDYQDAGTSLIWAIAGSFLQTHGTQQGVYFQPDTMQPTVTSAPFVTALDTLKAIATYGPPASQHQHDASISELLFQGRCVMTIGRSDMLWHAALMHTNADSVSRQAELAQPHQPALSCPNTPQAPYLCQIDTLMLPGAEVARQDVHQTNTAPYAAPDTWSGVLHAQAEPAVQEAGYALLSFLSTPDAPNDEHMLTIQSTLSPYRTAHVTAMVPHLQRAGLGEELATHYRNALAQSMQSPNVVLPLRIPHVAHYNAALHEAVTTYLVGTRPRDEAIQSVYNAWERITNEAGRTAQAEAYRASLMP